MAASRLKGIGFLLIGFGLLALAPAPLWAADEAGQTIVVRWIPKQKLSKLAVVFKLDEEKPLLLPAPQTPEEQHEINHGSAEQSTQYQYKEV